MADTLNRTILRAAQSLVRSEDSRAYDAFISYSRRDAVFARHLEQALERYRAPAGLELKSRRLRIFRDEGDLTGTAYFQAIEKHLANATKLIVICSPDARASQYVQDEIERFIRIHGAGSLIPVLVRGRPNNEVIGTASEAEAAFPEALCAALEMPLAVDYLDFDDKRDRFQRGHFINSWYMLLANLYDRSREEVEQRDLKRQRRQRIVTTSVVSTIVAVLTALTLFAFQQRNIAEDQRGIAEQQRDIAIENERRSTGLLYAAQSREDLRNNRFSRALGWAGAAYRTAPELSQVRSTLLTSFYAYRAQQAAVWHQLFTLDERPFATAFSGDRQYLVTGGEASVDIYDLNALEAQTYPAKRVWTVAHSMTGDIAYSTESDGTWLFDPAAPDSRRQIDQAFHRDLVFSPDGRFLLSVRWDGGSAVVHDLSNGSVRRWTFSQETNRQANVSFSRDGSFALINRMNGEAWIWPLGRDEPQPLLPRRYVRSLATSRDGLTAIATDDGLWWFEGTAPARQTLKGSGVRDVLFARDSDHQLVLLDNGTAGLWEPDRDDLANPFAIGDTRLYGQPLISPDGQLALFIRGGFTDTRAEVWRLSTPAVLTQKLDLTGLAVDIWFNDTSDALIAIGDKGVRRYFVGGDELAPTTQRFEPPEPSRAGQTSDGYALDAAAGSMARLTIPNGGQADLDAKCYITAPPVISSGRDLALLGTKCADARLFSVSEPAAQPVVFRPDSREMINAVAISADDRFVAVGGGANPSETPFEVAVFDAAAPESELFVLPARDAVVALAFSDDGRELIVGTADGTQVRWPLESPIAEWLRNDARFAWASDASLGELLD